MTITEAKRIGSRQGLISAGVGLLIAQFIMVLMFSIDKEPIEAFLWFTDFEYSLNIVIGVTIMFICGYFYGQLGGKLILIKSWNYIVTGVVIGLAVLLSTTFLASWTGFIQEGIDNTGPLDNPFFDYIIKPMYWVTMFGVIPALLIGVWFGFQVKRKGKIKTLQNNASS